jgi:hypothetical protein
LLTEVREELGLRTNWALSLQASVEESNERAQTLQAELASQTNELERLRETPRILRWAQSLGRWFDWRRRPVSES